MTMTSMLNGLLFGQGRLVINGAYTSGVGAGPFMPFPQHVGIAAGTIGQSKITTASADTLLMAQYDSWKPVQVVTATVVTAGAYAIQFNQSGFLAVSEGIGYGMLLMVMMAGHDTQAQAAFDGMLLLARTRYAYAVSASYSADVALNMMEWRIGSDGSSQGGGFPALDGDMDIALACLMAHRQWGSTPIVNGSTYNYLLEGQKTIHAIKTYNFGTDGRTTSLPNPSCSRTSDWMMNHFPAFFVATGDTFWTTTCPNKLLALTNQLLSAFSPVAGLLPDFCVSADTTTPIPSPGGPGNGDGGTNADQYTFNACRNPWRQGTHVAMTGDANWTTVVRKNVDFFKNRWSAAGGGIIGVLSGIDALGYYLDGTVVTGTSGNDPAFIAPVMVGAMSNSTYQTFLNDCWNWNTIHLTTQYFSSEIQMMCMMVANGNWWQMLSL